MAGDGDAAAALADPDLRLDNVERNIIQLAT